MAFGIILLIFSLYLSLELILLIYIYNLGYFNIEDLKNKYVKRDLNMINELSQEPGSINYLIGLVRFGLKASLFFIIFGYIMVALIR